MKEQIAEKKESNFESHVIDPVLKDEIFRAMNGALISLATDNTYGMEESKLIGIGVTAVYGAVRKVIEDYETGKIINSID